MKKGRRRVFVDQCAARAAEGFMSKARSGGDNAQVRGDEGESDLTTSLAKPAQRALAGAGYVRLEQLTRVSEAQLLQLHGMGPKALEQIRRALAAKGQSFADVSKAD
jgi:hypothetical protein